MPHVLGIGGVFIFAQDSELLAGWYQRHLGFAFERMDAGGGHPTFYQELWSRHDADPARRLQTVFAIMPAPDGDGAPTRPTAMVNYRVDDLEGFVAQLAAAGVEADPIHGAEDGEGVGKFTHIVDPEGNRIELWEHTGE
jgi:predicted enzyme related to lactoylglutathione lyase